MNRIWANLIGTVALVAFAIPLTSTVPPPPARQRQLIGPAGKATADGCSISTK